MGAVARSISKMTHGWETGNARVARVPILVILDHIYINSSDSNQANASNNMIWVQVSQNRGSFLTVAPVLVRATTEESSHG